MQNSIKSLLSITLLLTALLGTKWQSVQAQGISLPAEINKAFSPLSIAAGGTARLRVTIFNPNAFPLTNASWTDNLAGVQPGIFIASPVNLSNSCGGTVNAVAGATSFSLSGGTVPAQTGTTPGSCTVMIDVTSTTPGNLINTIPAGELTSTGNGVIISNTSPASATLQVGGAMPPTVNKSFSPGTIWAGQISQLQIVIRNNETGTTLTQASLSDELPANIFVADPVSATLTGCGNSASLSAVSGGTSVTLNNATIAPDSMCTIQLNVTSNIEGSHLNTIPANSLRTQQGLTNLSQSSARLNVQALGVTKQFMSSSIIAGEITTVTITLENPTSSPYTGVSVSDTLPGTVLIVVPGSEATTCGGTVTVTPPRTVSLSGGTIPAGGATNPGTCTITFDVTAPIGSPTESYTNVIPPGAVTTDQGVTNVRRAADRISVTGIGVRAIKSFSPSSILVGGNSRLRIDVTAPGDTDLTNFSITDNLPAGVTVSNSTPPAVGGCGPTPPLILSAATGSTTISLTNGLILAGQRCRIEVYVTSGVPGMYTNTIPPTNITNDQNRLPADSMVSNLTVGHIGNLALALVKGFDPLTVFGGSASTMSVELINRGTVALMDIAFTDNMPAGMVIASPPSPSVGTCGGTLIANPGESFFVYSGGSLATGSNCTLTVRVTLTVNGNLTNLIPAGAVTTTNGASNPDPVEATLTNLPGASVSKYFVSNPVAAGENSLLTITIQNTGNVPLSGMGLKDTLPAGLTIARVPAPVNNCGGVLSASPGSPSIELVDGALAATSSCAMAISVTASNAGDYRNTIPAGSLTTDAGVTNQTDVTDVLVVTDGVRGGGGGGNNRRPTPEPTQVTGGFLIPVTGFAPRTVTELDAYLRPTYAATSLTMQIPVIKVQASIVGVERKNGNWDVSWLQDQVGWLNGSAYPTWKGNSVLTGHVVNADGKAGVFSRLKYLGVGEYIFMYTSGYRYTYQVVSNELVEPDDTSVMQHEEKSHLTLITCDDYDERTGTYLRRVAVRAKLVDVRPVR